MTNNTIPYLSGGTFLAQILRARLPLATATEHTKCQKESLSEQEAFRRLISIFQLSDFFACSSLKPYTSEFKSCKKSLEEFTQFSDYDLRRKFDEDIKNTNSKALQMTFEFVQDFIDPDKYEHLVCSLLGLIDKDNTIDDNEEFFIDGTVNPIKKSDMISRDIFYIEPFILGIWHYVIMQRHDKNENGAATYNSWYPSRGKYEGTVGDSITQNISVKSVSISKVETVETVSPEEPQSESYFPSDKSENLQTINQYINHATIVNQYGEKSVHIDHVDTLNL